MGSSDAGTLAPAGVMRIDSDVWYDGNVSVRSGASFNVSSTSGFAVQALNGTGKAPTIAPVAAGAGTGSTATSAVGHDLGGSFVLTAAGTPAAGPIATVTFGTPLTAAPVSVVVSCVDTTGSPLLTINVGAGAFSTTGFSIVGPALTAAHTYLISYQVVAS